MITFLILIFSIILENLEIDISNMKKWANYGNKDYPFHHEAVEIFINNDICNLLEHNYWHSRSFAFLTEKKK